MKKLVGQREEVNPEWKRAVAIIQSYFSFNGPFPTKIQYDLSCDECSTPIIITLTEEVETGKIWLEGPDYCDVCNHKISDPEAHNEMLSQEAIAGFFGEH